MVERPVETKIAENNFTSIHDCWNPKIDENDRTEYRSHVAGFVAGLNKVSIPPFFKHSLFNQ